MLYVVIPRIRVLYMRHSVSSHFSIIVIKRNPDKGSGAQSSIQRSPSICCLFYQSSLTQTCYYITFFEADTLEQRPERMESWRSRQSSQNCAVRVEGRWSYGFF